MIRDEALPPAEIREYASDINNDARGLNRLITTMLDLDRMESGRMKLETEIVDLNELIKALVEALRAAASRHPLTMLLDTALPTVSADPDRISQVLTNLLNNAIEYSPEGGAIAVTSSRANGSGPRLRA